MNRNLLIGLSLKYRGEYKQIYQAIKKQETAPLVKNIKALTILDKNYPKSLLDLDYPPLVLFYKGDLSLLNEEKIAIIGSRSPCEYAKKSTALLASKTNKVVVSGLAKGIDGIAHLNALKTIAVLGCGIDYIYPKENKEIYDKVINHGLILSEYPDFVLPLANHFPIRNRIVIALSSKVYIMQATKNSGTMTSVNIALELGKDISVLPYNILEGQDYINNQLIYEGASIINEEFDF